MARGRTVTFTKREVDALRGALSARNLELDDEYNLGGGVTRAISQEAAALARIEDKLVDAAPKPRPRR